MIGSLTGILAEVDLGADVATEALIDVQGVGYRVTIGARHAGALGPIGTSVRLSVHTHVREGSITLYGFADTTERRTFELLLSTHGVGPALALAVLGVHTPSSLSLAIASGDVEALAMVPGIGQKTAQRLVLELAQRLDVIIPTDTLASPVNPAHLEVREALVAVGYASDEIRRALEGLAADKSTSELLRDALQELAPR